MSVLGINNLSSLDKVQEASNSKGSFVSDFSGILKNNIEDTNKLLNVADSKVQDFSVNRTMDLHEVMIAVEEAGMALSFTMQVRNKIVEAYQELMRTQV